MSDVHLEGTALDFRFTPDDVHDHEWCTGVAASACYGRGGGLRLHLGVCGSVAAYRSLDLVRMWQRSGFAVSATLTPAARKFVTPLPFAALGADPLYTDMYHDQQAISPFAHLEPAQSARALIIAPTSAATMSRLATGAADELLACQALAFPVPPVLAPAMNPLMWTHPATQANVALLRERGCRIIPPDHGEMACGDVGQGRLASLRSIWLAGLRAALPQSLSGVKALVTLGPTREYWDDVRFWSNPSTGTMGAALAVALWLRGAEVHAVCGPNTPWLPETAWLGDTAPLKRYDVITAKDMFTAAADLWNAMDAGLFTAAVADFAPQPYRGGKFKKHLSPNDLNVHFTPNQDILKTLAANRRQTDPQRVMGFAAETEHLENAVRHKLCDKRADMIVGNLVQDGFATAKNTVFVADRCGKEDYLPLQSKTALAWRLTAWLFSL